MMLTATYNAKLLHIIYFKLANRSNVKYAAKIVLLFSSGVPIFYLFWIIFVGTFSLHELLTGIIGAVLAALGVCIVDVEYPARFSPTLKELLSLWRLPWYLISGTWEIIVVAAEDLTGIAPAKSLFRIAQFNAGEKDDPSATARRVLSVVYTTIAPNFIVLGVNASDQKLLFHQIKRSSVPIMTKQLGAQA